MQKLENMAVKNWLPWKRQSWCSGDASFKIFPEDFLGKVVKFGGDSFNRREVIHLQSRRGPQKPPPRSEWG